MLLCFDIGGSRIKAAVQSNERMIPLGSEPTPIADLEALLTALRGFCTDFPIRAVAISIAGVVDPDSGVIKVANIPCLNGLVLDRVIGQALNLPVLVRNDADCFALAEARKGAGRGHRNVFGLILGTGIGGGLVLNGQLVTGAGGYAGELGHGCVVPEPWRRPCGCGLIGCLDAVCGARGLEHLHHSLTGLIATSQDIVAEWEQSAAPAEATIALWLDLISGPLAMVLNVLGASVVPVGGGLANNAALITALDLRLRAGLLRRSDTPLLVVAECGPEPGLIGAAEAARGLWL